MCICGNAWTGVGRRGATVRNPLAGWASDQPVPASGSATAAVVAAAAALVQKVARLSRKQWPEAGGMHVRAERLRLQSEELIEQDAIAYLAFIEAVRSGQGVAGARARTVQVPLEIARAAPQVAELAAHAAAPGHPQLRPRRGGGG